ncbi:hypothetical protein PISMIDRAFT_16314 [Pisolithus microcarpus 441]|uniref:Zn(2)-C6 fungal-type domain-containing protein n=1 Tax=Pisolithus microcarpus 441 TaxID=765257 RepID=A0A0C9YGF3_9AGAM|nr:hypothetical protein BKA83DRAFT_16314 [Pisolithus microcarpus]KIK15741.1 hypothetical protein PISMIDRAFT_16314 [Pisolithus microcarpus 441]
MVNRSSSVSNDSCGGFALNNPSPLHYPYPHEQWALIASDCAPPPYRSYALVGSLGDAPSYQPGHLAITSTTATYPRSQPMEQPQSSTQTLYSSTSPSEYPPTDSSYTRDSSSSLRYSSLDFSCIGYGSNSVSPMTDNGDSLMDHFPVPPPSVPTVSSSYFLCSSHQDAEQFFEQTLAAAPQPPQSLTASSAEESGDRTESDCKTRMTVPSQACSSNDPAQVNTPVPYKQTPACDFSTSEQAPSRRTQSPSPRTHQQAQASLIAQQLHPRGKSTGKKPALACLFCRKRKIACGPPLPGTIKTCSQCARRCLKCEYPLESRRGMHMKRRSRVPPAGSPSPGLSGSSMALPTSTTNGTSGPTAKADGASRPIKALYKGRKRSSDKQT